MEDIILFGTLLPQSSELIHLFVCFFDLFYIWYRFTFVVIYFSVPCPTPDASKGI